MKIRSRQENPYCYHEYTAEELAKPHKFVVTCSTGSYEDKFDRPVAVCDTEEEAFEYCENASSVRNYVEELAIKNNTSYCDITNDDEQDYLYSNLRDEFTNNVVYKEVFPDIYNDDKLMDEHQWSDEEEDKVYELDTDENFKKFLIEKGYSEEVAKATIIYNSCSYEHERLMDSDYMYELVPYITK